MFALGKALLILGRYLRRIAISLESIHELYALELAERGIYKPRKSSGGKDDEVEVMYGAKPEAEDSEDWR